uniref:Uncharacterized protein n=1 Tax=Romanomermis culicivorax TaxID=13658 RepID=A0A915HJA4_ROMCU
MKFFVIHEQQAEQGRYGNKTARGRRAIHNTGRYDTNRWLLWDVDNNMRNAVSVRYTYHLVNQCPPDPTLTENE